MTDVNEPITLYPQDFTLSTYEGSVSDSVIFHNTTKWRDSVAHALFVELLNMYIIYLFFKMVWCFCWVSFPWFRAPLVSCSHFLRFHAPFAARVVDVVVAARIVDVVVAARIVDVVVAARIVDVVVAARIVDVVVAAPCC